MRILALTLFPDMFPGCLGHSLAGQALAKGLWSLQTINIRDFATDKHRNVDEKPYGGGTGMVLRADILAPALDAAIAQLPHARRIYPSPRGALFSQSMAEQWKTHDLIILCGRFEGIDQRIIEHYQLEEVSLGDFVLSGGEVAAIAMLDACIRLLPGVIGKESALDEESFSGGENNALLLEYPHYTRPPVWEGRAVPEALTSGNHEAIRAWRRNQAETLTRQRRPDLWQRYEDMK